MTTLTLNPGVSEATLLAGIADETKDVIEFTAGTYSGLTDMVVNVDRIAPLTIRWLTGAVFDGTGSGGDGAFVLGFGGSASNITFEDAVFQNYEIGSIGVIWIGNADDITLTNITVTGCSATGDPTDAWALYLSKDAGVGCSNITATDWTVTGSGRDISGLQLQYAELHTNITATGWVVEDLAFALYSNAHATGVDYSDWTITDCGAGGFPSSVYFGSDFGTNLGTYDAFDLIGSDPIVNESAGGMVAGGGGSETPDPDVPDGPATNQTFVYRTPTTPAGPGWTEHLDVRLGSLSGISQEAELAAVGVSQISLDDPDADVGHLSDAIVGFKQFDWIEAAAPAGRRRIWTGYTGDRTYRRGSESESPSLITGPARLIDVTLSDINAFLTFRLLGNDATSLFNRPAETDVERIHALLEDVDFLSTTLFDGLVSDDNPVEMDAVDYTDQTPAEVINDCCQQSGKNAFVHYDEAGDYGPSPGRFVLFYDLNDSLVFPANESGFAVSNVLGDIDLDADLNMTGPVWAPHNDATLTRDPSRVVSGVKLRGATPAATVYVSNLSTSYQFGYRDLLVDAPNVKTEPKALARANRYLNDNRTEDDRLSFTLTLPAARVNDWMAGQYAPVRFSHLPGYDVEGGRNVRALSRTVAQDHETQAFYNVHYEAAPMVDIREPQGAFASWDSGAGGGIPILPSNTTPGNVLLLLVACVGGSPSTTLGAARCVDNPNLGSPPVGPHAGQAGWTQLGTVDTSALGQNILGPGAGFARSATILWRYVQTGEVTDHPVAVSGPSSPGGASAWLWELPTTTAPMAGSTFETTVGSPPTVPHNYSLPTTSGNAAGMLVFEFADTGGEEADVTVVSSGTTTVVNAQATNDPDNVTTTGWFAPWVWIGQKPAGGVLTINMATIPAYNNLAACGVTVELPVGITLPAIPYPANHT